MDPTAFANVQAAVAAVTEDVAEADARVKAILDGIAQTEGKTLNEAQVKWVEDALAGLSTTVKGIGNPNATVPTLPPVPGPLIP